jgi:hypothetical protein
MFDNAYYQRLDELETVEPEGPAVTSGTVQH